jgi:hypothetical protein
MGHKSLMEMDFKDAYMNFYSFGTKLKLIGQDDVGNQYHQMAQVLVDKKEENREQIVQSIQSILKLPDDPNFYLKMPI